MFKERKLLLWGVILSLTIATIYSIQSSDKRVVRNPYVQEYLVGTDGILGSVDTKEYTDISEDFAIGADRYGRAVFKNPNRAFLTFKELYGDAIEVIGMENELRPLSSKNYELYKLYGAQMSDESCGFVSRFLDIYENSFDSFTPNNSYYKPTSEIIDSNINSAVSRALIDTSSRYLEGEFFGEEHIILGVEEDGNTTRIYALTKIGHYGFVNNSFEKISGSGVIPAVVTIEENGNTMIEFPEDGSGYAPSIKRLFPSKYHARTLIIDKADSEALIGRERDKARRYLEKIGREAEVGDYNDFNHTLLTHLGISVEVSNKVLVFQKEYGHYPHFIGTREAIEDGVRVVYEMSYHEEQEEIRLTRYIYETKEIIEQSILSSITGEEIN